MTDKLTVDIWSDVMCPWCAIGYTQFAQALEQLEGEIEVETRFMPFELNRDLGPEGKLQDKHLAEVYGRSPEEVAQMRSTLEAAADKAGFPMDYDGEGEPPPAMMWNTLEAHKLLRWALSVSGPEAQSRLKMALFRAHFQQRRNVSDRQVLLEIAEREGFDRQQAAEALDDEALTIAVKLEERRALENNITSVPTFVVNGRYILQGAAEPEHFRQALYKLASMEAQA